jgi:hypothetical protein
VVSPDPVLSSEFIYLRTSLSAGLRWSARTDSSAGIAEDWTALLGNCRTGKKQRSRPKIAFQAQEKAIAGPVVASRPNPQR